MLQTVFSYELFSDFSPLRFVTKNPSRDQSTFTMQQSPTFKPTWASTKGVEQQELKYQGKTEGNHGYFQQPQLILFRNKHSRYYFGFSIMV